MNNSEYRSEVQRFNSGKDQIPYMTIIEWQKEDGYYSVCPDAYLGGVRDWEGGRRSCTGAMKGSDVASRKMAYKAGRDGAKRRGVKFGQVGLNRIFRS
jgi:hypothetical protein